MINLCSFSIIQLLLTANIPIPPEDTCLLQINSFLESTHMRIVDEVATLSQNSNVVPSVFMLIDGSVSSVRMIRTQVEQLSYPIKTSFMENVELAIMVINLCIRGFI